MHRLRPLMLVAGIVVLALIIVSMGPREILSLIRRIGAAFFLAAFLYWVHLLFRAYAIWRALPSRTLSLVDVIRIRMATEAIETLTFTGPFLAEPAKGLLFVKRGVAVADAAGVIAFEYLTYIVVATWLALWALVVLRANHAFAHAMNGPVLGLIVGLTVFSVGFAFAAVTGTGLLAPIVRRAGPIVLGRSRANAAADNVASMERVLLGFLHDRPALLFEVLLLQLVGHALLVVEVWTLFHAMALSMSAAQALLVEGGVKFINTVFFFVPGQVGASEGVNALIAKSLGYPGAAGVTLAIVRRLRSLLVAACGLPALPQKEARS